MLLWNSVVEILRESIFAYAQACQGNLGWGIVIVTCLARLALAPLGIRLAIAAKRHQTAMARIQPALDALRAKYKGDAQRLAVETRQLLQREGISLAPAGLLGNLAQIPVMLALYSAIRQVANVGGRFFWIRSLAMPDPLLTVVVVGVTAASTFVAPVTSSSNQGFTVVFSVIMTAVVLSKMAAGIGLYWGLSSLFGVLQSVWVQRTMRGSAA